MVRAKCGTDLPYGAGLAHGGTDLAYRCTDLALTWRIVAAGLRRSRSGNRRDSGSAHLKLQLDARPSHRLCCDLRRLAVAASATWVNGGCGGHSPDVVSRFAAISGITYDASCGSEALTMVHV
eukprot:3483495-Rhodomonas_salina.2